MYQFDRERYNERMAWWLHDRFGMFIHFGLYAIPARGEWVRSIEEIPNEAYQPYFDEFNPYAFDAREWARAARRAGMKYMVLTAKHHDGFCLFDSALTDYKVTNTPFGRDIVAEYVEACRAEGLKVGLYYSLIDWHHPDFPQYGDAQAPLRNDPVAGSNEGRVWERYLEYLHGQVRELCTNYGKLDLLWFDFSYDDMCGEKWGATKLMNMVRELQPNVIVDNRLEVSGEGFGSLATCEPTPYHGDFVTPEQMIPPTCPVDAHGDPLCWEACMTMNGNWGYCAADNHWKSPTSLVRTLVECVSKGGNMILNVGPDATGRFPAESLERLDEIGRWMDRNSQSIYGCGAAAGGPAGDLPPFEYGRITRNGDVYYFHLYEKTVGATPLYGLDPAQVENIRRLADGSEVPMRSDWVYANYPGVVFADLGPETALPDVADTVLAVKVRPSH